jgi:hypothetical protein
MAFACSLNVLWPSCSAQFRFQLRRDDRQQLSVVGNKRQFHICFAEYQSILPGFELYGAAEMRFVHFSVCWNPLKLHALGTQVPSNTPARNGDDPCETHVHQESGLFLMRL